MNTLSRQDNPNSSICQKALLYLRAKCLFWIPKDRRSLIQIIQRAASNGLIDNDSLVMIEGVFHVSDMRVRDIMVPRPQMKVIQQDADFNEMQTIIVDSAHSRFPVVSKNDDSVKGILLAKDILRYLDGKDKENFRVHDLIRAAYVVPESKRLQVLLEEFRRTRNHMAIVVDEYGEVSGLVTIEDVLEQIVGDITDEHDVAEDQYIYDLGENNYSVKAVTPLNEFNDYFEVTLKNDNADTIGGLIIAAFRHLPKRGETIEIDGISFEVNKADTRRVHSLLVKK